MLWVMKRMPAFKELHAQAETYIQTSESISRQLRGWANSLPNSEIEGQRHLNDRSRKEFEAKRIGKMHVEQHRQWRADMEEKLKRNANAQNKPTDAGEETG